MSLSRFKLFLFTLLVTMFFYKRSWSQHTALKYINATQFTQIGEILPVSKPFHRIDTSQFPQLPAVVKHLLSHSAGKAISFKTNSSVIAAKWCVTSDRPMNNLTAIGQSGLDLYIKRNGKWVFAGVGRPNDKCNEGILVENMDHSEKECLLYLPLYNETLSLEIGIEKDGQIGKAESPFKKRILIYGSSIVQGASASRPGLAYPARLSRATGLNFINLGLSGNAKMHFEVADMIREIPADAYILDCVPNSSPEEIHERTENLVKTIRAANPHAPIIMIESLIREGGNWNLKTKERVSEQNNSFRLAYERLLATGVKDVYFIKEDNFLGDDHEGTVDGTHPNDLGFDRFLKVVQPQLLKILGKYSLTHNLD